jgi:hypothetical protein
MPEPPPRPWGASSAWGEDGSVLYVTANHWILRLRTTTKGPRLDRAGAGVR